MQDCASKCDGQFTVVIYLDKAVPGQANRHDHGRTCQSIYITILEFPDWFISRRNGWIPFSYVLHSDQVDREVTDSMLLRFIVRTFHNTSKRENFECGLPIDTPIGFMRLRLKTSLTICDWEELVHLYHLVGYNGSVPCGVCRNVLGRCPPFEDDYLVHISSHETHRFDFHTAETYKEIRDQLLIASHGSPETLRRAQQVRGVKFDIDGWLYDPMVYSFLQPPFCMYSDWMHGFVASGGVAQYELNQFTRQLCVCCDGIALADIDEWVQHVKKVKGAHKLKKTFFQDRIVDRPNAHINAFAGECLTAVGLLGLCLLML